LADSSVAITAGSGTLVDSRTIGSEHRQVVVLGDETAATIAEVVGQALAVRPVRSATATVNSVADTTTTATLLASNTARLKACFYNSSTATLFLKLGSAASTSSYTVALGQDGYFELPADVVYTGIITGVWSADTAGVCLVTELI
jgi:hypothetical protein